MTVHHAPEQNRFTADTEAGAAHLDYVLHGEALAFVHTLVPEGARGQGVGSALAQAGLDYARREGRAVIPECPFMAVYVQAHPETQDLLASG